MSRADDRPYVTVGQDKRHFQKAIRAFERKNKCIVLGMEEPNRGDAPREHTERDVD